MMGDERFSARDALSGWMQEIAPYGIFTTDSDLRIRTWNNWLAAHSGQPAEKVVGQLLVDAFPEVKARRLDESFRRALGGQVSVLSTALHKYLLQLPVRGDDASLPFMLQTVRIAPLAAGGVVLGTVTVIEDVTQRERHAMRLQRQQEYDRLLSTALGILLQSSDPLRDAAALFPKVTLPLGLETYLNFLYDPDTRTLRLNSAGGIMPKHREALAAVRLDEPLFGGCATSRKPLVRGRLGAAQDEVAHAMRRLGFHLYCSFPLQVEGRLLGTLAFASSTRAFMPADEVECLSTVAKYVAVAMDRVQREHALRDAQHRLSGHAEMLEAKVAERTARLHETIAQLESFSYTVAHDLRAPIRALKGYCDILISDFTLPAEGTALLRRLQRASNRLDALTRDLLEFSRIARQDVRLERVDLADLMQDLELITPALGRATLAIQPPLAKVWAQRTLLQQCLSNLFDNAVKFATPGVPSRIVVRCERREGEAVDGSTPAGQAFNPAVRRSEAVAEDVPGAAHRVRLWVEDNGIGIPADAHEKIFGIFERGTGIEHIEGTGIGLAIVARAMQQMGGECGVESAPGQGSRFWLEFSAAEGPSPTPGAS